MSQSLTIIGNLADDPELRFTGTGKAVASFRVITSRSRKDEAGQWQSEGTTGWFCQAWDRLAENVAESLRKGDAVIVHGRAEWRSWENKDGSKGGRLEVTAWNVGLDLKRNPAQANRTSRERPAAQPAAQPDPWSGQSEQAPF